MPGATNSVSKARVYVRLKIIVSTKRIRQYVVRWYWSALWV